MVHVWCQLPGRPEQAPRLTIAARGGELIRHVDLGLPEWEASGLVARMGVAQRLIDIADEKQREEIALKYQLLTAQTNFFLVHERAQLDKASGVPALQQVGHMLAAGWGGTGSVGHMKFGISADLAPSLSRRQADSFEPLRSPAAWRRQPRALAQSFSSAGPGVYASLAQAMAHRDEPDNPLRQLLQQLDSFQGSPDALPKLLAHIERDPHMAFLEPVLQHLRSVTGSDEIALAVLLDWGRLQMSDLQIPRRSWRPVAAMLGIIVEEIYADAVKYLEASSSRESWPLDGISVKRSTC